MAHSLRLFGDRISFRVFSDESLWLRVLPGGSSIAQPKWMPVRILGGSRAWGETSITSDMHPFGRKGRTKEPLDESKRGEWKSWLKPPHSENEDHGIQSHHFMANRWGNNGNSERLFFGVPKCTADGDCSHEIKRLLLLGRKAMTSLYRILKSIEITLSTKVYLVKAMVFQWSCMGVRVGLWRKMSAEELMLLNCGVGEDSWESLGLQGDPTSPFWRSALGFLWKEWC